MKPTLRICHICGREYESRATREFFCPACKPEAERRKKARNYAAKKARLAIARERKAMPRENPGRSIEEQNRYMRDRGLTYGGRPIVSQHVGWPKFLREARKQWRKNA